LIQNPDAQGQIIRKAVSGMLPKNKLRARQLERLKIFPGPHMGKVGANVLKSWDDGTLSPDYDPHRVTTSETLKENWRETYRAAAEAAGSSSST